ncbi:MAG: alpha/beta hydrolase [Niabella sp.]|nr:alpha/beta hydrolase [Niabella sp.]
MRTIYCIPGFGVDERIFSNLRVDNATLQCINWLDPLKGESFHSYAMRMADLMTTDAPLTIIGISFGGMVAQEIARFRNVQQIILISSVKSRSEMPLYMRIAGALKLNKLFPVKAVQKSDRVYKIANRRLGAYTPEEREFADVYRKTANLNYINWSFDKILNWRNLNGTATAITHIHGSKDQVLPIKYIKADYVIEGGTHMMAWNRAEEISRIISEVTGGDGRGL